jgi:hypothetical protein
MTKAGPFVRLRRLDGRRKRLLLRAAAWLGIASAAVALMPFRHAIVLGSVPLRARRPGAVDDLVWAVETVARRLPWRAVCIEKGLAAQRMLRSAGVDAVLHYGARHQRETEKLEAHVWVSVAGAIVIGGEEAKGFREIATFP